jgi:selenocysteine lyase/cysteine desulfurase
MYATSLATAEPLTAKPLTRRPQGDFSAACTQRLPGTTADGLVVPTSRGPRDYANLDHAASTPALTVVAEAVERTLRTYASVHRGNGFASRVTSEWYEQAREEVARFIGAREDDLVVFTRTTTDSWNLLARTLPADTTVVVFASEHHSTLLPWGTRTSGATVTLPVPRTVEDGLAWLDSALAESTGAHTLVVVSGASNVTGEVWPVEQIVAVAHRHGARVALDAAQLAPHRAVDLAASGVDYVAFSGHKLYAPYGAGVLAGRADWLDAAEPYLVGGGATARVGQVGSPGPPVWRVTRAAAPTSSAPSPRRCVRVLQERREDLARYEHTLAERLRRGLEQIPGVHTHSLFGAGSDRVGVVAFTIDGLDSSLVSTALSVEHGIGVRDGKFCAHPLVDALLADGDEGTPTTAVRASLGLASRPEHVERLVSAVTELAASGPGLTYTRGPQGWAPESDPRVVDLPRPW